MSIYLHDIPLPEAQARLEAALREAGRWGRLGIEEIPLDEAACGRVLAEAVWARISSPHYHAAAMDGFAVRAADTAGAQPGQPLRLECREAAGKLEAAYVDTGDPLPPWADAVIPIEHVEPVDEQGKPASDLRHPVAICLRAAVTPWLHVRPLGEDIVATQLVLPAGHVLRPVDLGAIAACGHSQVKVARRPRVAILPTGSELVPVGQPVQVGDIIEYNSLVLAAQVNGWGGQADRFPITPDDFDQICQRVREAAADHDLILLNAGSSAGSEDYSARVVESLGTLLVHGVAVRPGHPVILGMIRRAEGSQPVNSVQPLKKSGRESPDRLPSATPHAPPPEDFIPIIGVPGYPVSAAMTGEIFVEPLLWNWLGLRPARPMTVRATLTRKVVSPPGDDDYLRLTLGRVGDRLLAAPLPRGAGVITSLVKADGIGLLPRGSQGMSAGEEIEVRLYRSIAEIEQTIFAIGSHDLTLDLLAQFLAERGRRLASTNVGSQGGLVALRRGEAHFAGSHLFDPETGEFNLPAIRRYLPEVPVRVVTLVGRQQGLIVPPGNPKEIRSLDDLARPEVVFVNRQRGSGTRVLLDHALSQRAIDPGKIRGYNQEEYNHLAVAAAVSSGRADCGLGIAAAAQALNLDFVPLFQERYDLVIPRQHAQSPLLAPLFQVLEDHAFRQAVSALPGYDVSRMGQVVAEL